MRLDETSSRSTQKLIVLTRAVETIPEELIKRVKSFELSWKEVEGEILPTVNIQFKD